MIPALLMAQAAPQSSVEIDAGWLLGAIGVLAAIVVWFVKREFGRIDKIEDKVQQLLAGETPWVKGMRLEISNLRDDINRRYRPRDDE